jgi:hypothetical protein
MFLRQPAIALALALLLGMFSLRRRSTLAPLRAGSGLLGLWLLLYCLSLSTAYYTARAALLPALVGLAVALGLTARLSKPWRYAGVGLLLVGFAGASSFAVQDFTARLEAARQSAALRSSSWAVDQGNPLVFNPVNNSWCLPLPTLPWTPHGSWLDDPAIPPVLTDGREVLDVGKI